MDTSSSSFIHVFNFFLIISAASAAPGLLGLDKLLQGPRYDTHIEPEKVTFLHFTRNPSEDTTENNDVTKDYSKLDSSLPLVIILHGFMGSPHGKSTQLLIEGYMHTEKYNVVAVNWTDLAKGPWYGIAAERSYEAARQLALWMNELVTANLTKWEDIHIVGFSLGAQVAGLTSKYIPNGARVGRLTGLDPARPMFDDKTHEDHLDAEDSDFTTVVHTCGGFLAVPEPRGHVDFYPNGGEHPQPPCSEELLNSLLLKHVYSPTSTIDPSDRGPTKIFAGLVCSHYMALALWVESLKPTTKFISKSCSSWKKYLNNTCDDTYGSTEVEMGENIPRSTRGIYFIKTEAEVPYASTLNTLIADGIKEYSKILMADEGHGEVQEVTPEIKIEISGTSTDHSFNKNIEHKHDDINRIDLQSPDTPSSSSRNIGINFYIVSIFVLLITSLRLK